MLKNIRESNVDKVTKKDAGSITIVYNQKPITVAPGEDLDVRDFGVPSESIVAVEKHILVKNPNVFEQSKTEDIFKTAKAALNRIKDLENENARLKEDLGVAQKGGKGSDTETAKVKAENEGLTNEIKSLKKQVGELKAKIKALK